MNWKELKNIAIIGVLAIFLAGVLGMVWMVQISLKAQTQIDTLQDTINRQAEDYTKLYKNYLLLGNALNQTSAKALEYQSQLEELRKQGSVVYKYPMTPPYEVFPDPINFDQVLVLLYGMRASHVMALNWTFQGSPGFGIDDKEFQLKAIKWYDQLIFFVYEQRNQISVK